MNRTCVWLNNKLVPVFNCASCNKVVGTKQRYWMKACSQLYAPVDLPHGKNPPAFIVKQALWAPAPV